MFRRKLPDHSLLKVTINMQATSSPHTGMPRNNTNMSDTNTNDCTDNKYNVKNIPNDFFSSNESRNCLINIINAQELAIECQDTVNRYYNDLVACIFKEMEQYLPKIYGSGPRSNKRFKIKKPYWNENLKNLWTIMCQNEKNYLNYRGTNHVKQFLQNIFKESSKLFHRELRRAERNYNKATQNKIESICTDNPRQFWRYIKKLGPKYKPDIPEEVYDSDGNVVTDINSVLSKWKSDYENLYKSDASLFDNDFYNQIVQLLNNVESRMNDPLYTSNYELNKNITADEVNFVIDKLKNNKSPGIDKIPNEVLKSIPVKSCLLKLYQYYFDTGIFPSCWNQAIIKPIPKSKSKDPRVPLNYRGINLLSNIYKAYSSIINKRLTSYLESNDLLEDVQNGFRKDRNCLDHIYVLYSIIKNRKNRSLDTFVSYIDFYKCFDMIDRNMLFFKLTEFGIDGKMYQTLKQMYTNTSSCVNVNNKMTDWFITENGCRQGDVNSPTAFSMLINGLLKELNSCGIGVKINPELIVSVLAFADDIVLLAESPEDLQKLISIVHKWSSKWRFIINPEKSQVVHYRNAPKIRTSFIFKLHESGPTLQIVDSYKYLGVYLDEFLTFSHTTEILATAGGRALGSMINKFRSLSDMGHSTYSKLYDSLVAPVTDYGSAIWGYKRYKQLDKVQNRATRFFTGVHKFAPIVGHVGDMGWVSNRG